MTAGVKLKVCGMREKINILEVAKLLPDYMGFIFFPKSPRFVGNSFAIPEGLPDSIRKVGVFVDDSVSAMKQIVEKHDLDFVQLHGNESPDVCGQLRSAGIGVIKVFSISDDFDFGQTKRYRDTADFFLFDTRGKFHGGNGSTFNWKVLDKYDLSIPFFLSGGLTVDNVRAGVDAAGPYVHAVDVNSGVEVLPAVKDPSKIRALKQNLEQNL